MDLEQFRLPASISTSLPAKPIKPTVDEIEGWFIRGPLQGDWLVKAMQLTGDFTTSVALAILYVKGLKQGKTVKLERYHLGRFGVKKDSARRALKRLQEAGLISYTKKGQKFTVTVHPYTQPSHE